jgi:hypothetical protein
MPGGKEPVRVSPEQGQNGWACAASTGGHDRARVSGSGPFKPRDPAGPITDGPTRQWIGRQSADLVEVFVGSYRRAPAGEGLPRGAIAGGYRPTWTAGTSLRGWSGEPCEGGSTWLAEVFCLLQKPKQIPLEEEFLLFLTTYVFLAV